MADLSPGNCILYRDGDRYLVARIDLAREGYYTAFPFDPAHRRWSKARRRLARAFVVAALPADTDVEQLSRRIECLRNQRDARRQIANHWLDRQVRQLTHQKEPA